MEERKRVVIVGGGFGGLAAARALKGSGADVLLIDRSNHHLFQPLLYQVATAALSPADIAAATRSLLAPHSNVSVLMDEVTGVDAGRRLVHTARGPSHPYDHLVLATGADYSFFGHDEWAPHAPVLKTLDDALRIRERLLAAFEEAERSADDADTERLLTFVVVGGGPTGVEMAGAIAELARTALAEDFRRISARQVRIMLVEAGPAVLSSFSPKQSAHALAALRERGVQVMLGKAVELVDEAGIVMGGERIASANVIWCAGTQARPAADWLGAAMARNRAVLVEPDCSIPGRPEIFAIGDVASHRAATGAPLPGLAAVAKQQGKYVAKVIKTRMAGNPAPPAFRYRNWGTMAVIGRSRAVADFGWLRLQGYVAWLAWSLVHLLLLVDFRSRLAVYVNWTWSWFTHGRAARLLTSTMPRMRRGRPERPSRSLEANF